MKIAAAFAALVAALPALAADEAGWRNTLTLSADAAREDARPVTGGGSRVTAYDLDGEFARSLWTGFELTFALGARGLRTTDAAGTTSTQTFRAYQVGFRQYLGVPGRATWTPYADASLGEGWLTRAGGRTRLYGYELGIGLAAHLSPRVDLRVGAGYDRYVAYDKVGDDRDTFTRRGLRLGVAYRF